LAPLNCPECGSQKLWKDGVRYTTTEQVQRYICRNCGYRFSDPNRLEQPSFKGSDQSKHVQKVSSKILKRLETLPSYRQICAPQPTGAKNLATVEKPSKSGQAGATEQTTDIKGKIIEFLWWAEKEGYAQDTIRCFGSCLRALLQRGANLFDPESVKEVLAREKVWSQNRRRNVINAYTKFLEVNGFSWKKPKCKVERKIPFIPTEQELDTLIAGSGRKLAAFLQLLKETAMRAGEAKSLHWTDVDFERRLITLNNPEKGSNSRIWKVSQRLIDMLNALPKEGEYIFNNRSLKSLKATFLKTRKRLTSKLQNPRLLRISFHTFRHWKATMEYHRTRDPWYVKEFLGHKSIKNTEIYITIEKTIFGGSADDEFHVKVASNPEEIKQLLTVGYEYICEKDGLLFFRKRK
jgi:integrase